MFKNKKTKKILLTFISISFIISSFLGVIHYCCFDENFYTKQHDKLLLNNQHIYDYIGISRDELIQLTHFTLTYLNDADASLDIKMDIKGINREVFNDDEKLHMVDVKNLNLIKTNVLIITSVIFVISLIIFILTKLDIKSLYENYKKTLFSFLCFFSIIGFWILIDFNSFWTYFHELFFAGNDLWLLSLKTDILIMIVPPEFFNNLVIRIVCLFIILLVIFYLVLYLLSRKKKNYD